MSEENERVNPAALEALMKGDIANFLTATTPGGIELQEAQGQKDFINSELLPINCNFDKREDFEAMGIVYGEEEGDLFVNVTLPKGWKKVPTEHSMWSNLVDDKGEIRAHIFFKAAFYNMKAHIDLCIAVKEKETNEH